MHTKNKIKKIIIFLSLTTLFMYIVNKVIFSIATVKNILSKKGDYYDWRFGKLFYTKQGNGPPILLIHDLTTCSSSYEWNNIVNTLSKKNTVYALDLIGCGRSDKPNLTYTNFLYVQLISDFIKNIIKHKTDIIVTGASSSFVIMACHNDEALIKKIMLINPECIMKLNKTPSKRSKMIKFIINIPIFGTLLYNIAVSRKQITDIFYHEYYSNNRVVPDIHINAYFEASHLGQTNAKYLYSSIKGYYTNINILHALKEITNSIFIVGGSQVYDIRDRFANYTYYNASIEVTFLPNTGALPQLENPDQLLDYISIFFSQKKSDL